MSNAHTLRASCTIDASTLINFNALVQPGLRSRVMERLMQQAIAEREAGLEKIAAAFMTDPANAECIEQEIALASEREHLSKSEFVHRALVAYVSQRKVGILNMSALEQAGDLMGCFSGGPSDLSSKPRHLEDFGRV